MLAAKSKLVLLGCTITDTKVMDVLLMQLDFFYHPVHITILSQKSEPKLKDIKAILTASSASDDVIKLKRFSLPPVLIAQKRSAKLMIEVCIGVIWIAMEFVIAVVIPVISLLDACITCHNPSKIGSSLPEHHHHHHHLRRRPVLHLWFKMTMNTMIWI